MLLKAEKLKVQEESRQYDLRNSIISAIQGHVYNGLVKIAQWKKDLLNQTTLSASNVFNVYTNACRHIQDWTQAIDFGPYKHILPTSGESLGTCESGAISTHEFFLLKQP